jgi:hypothetical protein
MVAIGDIGLVMLILGIVLLLFSIAPSPFKGDLRQVGWILAVLGAIVYVLLLVL